MVFRPEAASTSTRLRQGWRKHGFWIVCGTVFVLLSVLGYLLSNSGGRSSGTLSITNPAPAGAQAAAAILADQGVSVTASDSLSATQALLQGEGPGASTVLFYDPNNFLSPARVGELTDSVSDAGGKLVAVAPGPLATQALSPELSSVGTAGDTATVAPGCGSPAAVAAGTIDGGTPLPGTDATTVTTPLLLFKGAQTCFIPAGSPAGGGGFLASNSAGDITALGNPGVVINQNLASRGNAALTMRLLGSTPKLIWYTATIKDIPVAQHPPTLAELTPQWIFPASLWLLLVAMLGMVWRGRRHGPLVSEPLPVHVKASETLAGRARLYQDARALDTAAASLRQASLTRLARTLRLGISAEPDAVVHAVASATGRPQQQLHALLLGEPPLTEKLLLSMAVELAALEEEVARR
ncbi:hypothetical protein ART_1707 [Arthrobacter sp. PAMC 25486]|nr:hypothetical protein ART_1707 [Arthrobacter sp. PAMC 25486]